MGWLIALGILVLLAILPLGVGMRYSAEGALVRVIAGPFRITVFPMKKQEKKVLLKPKTKMFYGEILLEIKKIFGDQLSFETLKKFFIFLFTIAMQTKPKFFPSTNTTT